MSEHPEPAPVIRPPLERYRLANQLLRDDAIVQSVIAAAAAAERKTRGGAKTQQLADWSEGFNANLRRVAEAVVNADMRSEPESSTREAYLDAVQGAWQRLSDQVELLRTKYPHIREKLPTKNDFIGHGPKVAERILDTLATPVVPTNARQVIEDELEEIMSPDAFFSLKEKQRNRTPSTGNAAVVTSASVMSDNAVRSAIINVPGKNNTTWYHALITATHAAVGALNQTKETKVADGLMADLVLFEKALGNYAQKVERYRGNTATCGAAFNDLKNAYYGLEFKLRREYGENLVSVNELDALRPAMREAALAILPADPKLSQPLKTQGTRRDGGAGTDFSGRGG